MNEWPETPTIEINENELCRQCGKPGACKPKGSDKYGLCLDCVTKNLERRYSMIIGEQTLVRAIAEITGLLESYITAINQAYTENEDALTVALSLKFEPTKLANVIKTTVGITFVESRVKDSHSFEIDEKQRPLFNNDSEKGG